MKYLKKFEDVKERSSNSKSEIQDYNYVILDHHDFHYKISGDELIIGQIIPNPNNNTYGFKYIIFDDNSKDGYYDISKIMYWSNSKEELLVFFDTQKFNI